MKIKYILWVICALLLLNTSVILAQEIGGTNTTGTNQNDPLMPFVVGLVTIGVGSLMIKKTKRIRIKENFNEKNNTQP